MTVKKIIFLVNRRKIAIFSIKMRCLKFIVCIMVLDLSLACHAQGLKFNGSETSIENRTSFSIPRWSTFSDSLSISFDIKMYPDAVSGYIIHMATSKEAGAPMIDLFYDGTSENRSFGVICEGVSYVVNMNIPKSKLGAGWTPISLSLYPGADSAALRISNGFSAGGHIDLPSKINPKINFGKSDYIIDVPSFAIRDLIIAGDAKHLSFKFDEDSGNTARSSMSRIDGTVENPIWLVNDASHWREEWKLSSSSFLSIGYNEANNEVYAFSRDSIFFFNIEDKTERAFRFKEKCPVEISLGTNYYDPRTNEIYSYEVYYSHDMHSEGAVSAARLDLASMEWSPLTSELLDMQMHHHDEFLDTAKNRFIIFGGFGNRRYNGDFYSFSLDSLKWSRLPAPKGETIWPRYFSSLGYDPGTNALYIFGGMGNKSGDQVVGRRYFYDLHEISLSTWTSRELWSIPWEGVNCVAARNMVVSPDGDFLYIAGYPESVTDSHLSIYRFSIDDGTFEELADPVPIFSDKITTNANLHEDESLEKLILTVEESPDDIRSSVSVYTINFPPKAAGIPTVTREHIISILKSSIAGLIIILLLLWLIRLFVRRRRLRARIPEYVAIEEPQENCIMLFGQFTARDRFGNDISEQFTTKLKELLCLVLQYREGITSKKISSLLWPEKGEDEAKNVRGVTISNLRKLLREIEGVSLVFSEGKFLLKTENGFYCDYFNMMDILDDKKPDLDTLILILSRGSFLKSETDPFYDKLKGSVEQRIAPIMQVEVARRYGLKQYQTCLKCVEILFGIDPFSDDALFYGVKANKALQRNDAAAELYHSFIVRYKNDYGQDYPKSYEDIK
jgi:hypothetical protein